MGRYHTEQRSKLISFFKENPDKRFSAKQIAESLNDGSISKSAVYRNLSDLAADGKIERIAGGKSREIFYRYTDAEECKGCIHLFCVKCGKTFHMNKKTAENLVGAISEMEKFTLNKSKTVLYGVCSDCDENAVRR